MNARAQRARHKKKNQLIWSYESTGNYIAKQVHQQFFNRQIAIYINMPTLTVINIIKMPSNQNAPKRWIGVHTEHNHTKKESLQSDLRANGKLRCKVGI